MGVSPHSHGTLSVDPAWFDPPRSSAALWEGRLQVHPDTKPHDPIFQKWGGQVHLRPRLHMCSVGIYNAQFELASNHHPHRPHHQFSITHILHRGRKHLGYTHPQGHTKGQSTIPGEFVLMQCVSAQGSRPTQHMRMHVPTQSQPGQVFREDRRPTL
ncbi:hypothetical protein JVT61DRAFT_12536 [Boletus reticuloceps]|uniref:Uncharacterized protein n=1 Tax=Boletus reticuloceps TaxID=495285 RepID=A0A8I2YDV1_9AGAM|nr:hypothetical protein JVT61DRAFT_12536 [Boletus reticuloceps]